MGGGGWDVERLKRGVTTCSAIGSNTLFWLKKKNVFGMAGLLSLPPKSSECPPFIFQHDYFCISRGQFGSLIPLPQTDLDRNGTALISDEKSHIWPG